MRIRFLLEIAVIAVLSSCGGGGGDRAAAVIPGLAGKWDGSLSLTSDGCLLGEEHRLITHQIEIRDAIVTLLDEEDRRFEGQAESETGFEVSWSGNGTQTLTTGRRIVYSHIRNQFADAELVYFEVSPGGDGCETKWNGVVSKDQTPVW